MSDSIHIQEALATSGTALKPESAAWLGSCLNPYSDYPQSLVGYPDLNTQASVVRMYSTQVTITAPSTGNWDCVLYCTPIDTDQAYKLAPTNIGSLPYSSTSPTGTAVWPLTILTGATGSDMSFMSPTADRDGLYSRNVAGVYGRVIAKGFEVHNTTAEIYKQGTVVSAIVPAAPVAPSVVTYTDTVGGSTASPMTALTRSIGRMPATLQELRAIPQSVQWEAASGVYFVPRMTSNPTLESTVSGLSYATTTATYGPAISGMYGTVPIQYTTGHDAFGTGVAWFTGLSPQTMLTVSFRTIVEYFPTPDSNLISEASPSAPYDPNVLAVYNSAAKEAPYAVPVSQNAAGDFFRKVLGAVKRVAPVASKLLTPFPLASKAAGLAGRLADNIATVSPVAPLTNYPRLPDTYMLPQNPPRRRRNQRSRQRRQRRPRPY